MRAIPIPDGVAEQMGGRRFVIGEADPTREDVRPCEYVITESTLYRGRPACTVLVELDDDDRAAIASGQLLWLRMDGGELPWELGTIPKP